MQSSCPSARSGAVTTLTWSNRQRGELGPGTAGLRRRRAGVPQLLIRHVRAAQGIEAHASQPSGEHVQRHLQSLSRAAATEDDVWCHVGPMTHAFPGCSLSCRRSHSGRSRWSCRHSSFGMEFLGQRRAHASDRDRALSRRLSRASLLHDAASGSPVACAAWSTRARRCRSSTSRRPITNSPRT